MGEALRDTTAEGMNDSRAYCEHLFDATTDGHIHFLDITHMGGIKKGTPYSIKYQKIYDHFERIHGHEDVYISPNTTYRYKRDSDVKQFRSLYIDIDVETYGKHTKLETRSIIDILVAEDKIPKPSQIIDSGRGFHLYFRIHIEPKQAEQIFRELEYYLYFQLKDLGADRAATDSVRVLRIPGTINSRNGAVCKIVYQDNNIKYTMRELWQHYIGDKVHKEKNIVKQEEVCTKRDFVVREREFNSYTLHTTRTDDIIKLCELRNYDVEGYRNFIIHCYSYWRGICTPDPEKHLREVLEFNAKFKKPLRESQVKSTCRSVGDAVDKFIDYQYGRKNGNIQKPTKGMTDKQGYWYTNKTLIERLNITEAEQMEMKTIFDTPEKYHRRNVKRNANRRNANGLTARQQAKQDNIEAVKALHTNGLTQAEIVKKLGITKGTVSKYLIVS